MAAAASSVLALIDLVVRRKRLMAVAFALGATCFLIAPFPGYYNLVGESAVGITFFVGSILFTVGGGLQTALARRGRHGAGASAAAFWSAAIQSVGTVFFNVTTFEAMSTAISNPQYDQLVWRPDALGSVCFLVSGAIASRASPRQGWRGWRPIKGAPRLVAGVAEPGRLHLLRRRGDRRLRRPLERIRSR